MIIYIQFTFISITINLNINVRALSDLALLFKNSIYIQQKNLTADEYTVWHHYSRSFGSAVTGPTNQKCHNPRQEPCYFFKPLTALYYTCIQRKYTGAGTGRRQNCPTTPPPSAPCKNQENGRIGLLKFYSHEYFSFLYKCLNQWYKKIKIKN